MNFQNSNQIWIWIEIIQKEIEKTTVVVGSVYGASQASPAQPGVPDPLGLLAQGREARELAPMVSVDGGLAKS
jgi:hypothetical protein